MNILPLEKEQFIINNNYILREIGEDIVLIPKNYCKSKIKSNLYSFQGVGADVIRRIDGIATIKTIINDLINIYDVNYKVLVHDVKEFLKYLVIQGIVNSVDSNMHREILPITDIVTDNHFLSIYQNN